MNVIFITSQIRENLDLGEKVGEGKKAEVFKAMYCDVPALVKVGKVTSSLQDFHKEALVMW